MSLLKRRSPPRAYDDHLTYFTVAQANDFRRLVERSFAGAGRDVSVYADRIEDRDGTTLGLWNMGMLCAGAEPREWPGLIADHVKLVSAPPRALAELAQAELEEALRLRLVEAAAVADPDRLAYARAVAPGLLEVLAVDLGDSVTTPSRDELDPRGALADLVERGRANLRALLETAELRVEIDTAGSKGRFASVTGESFFTASLALVLSDAVLRLTGDDHVGPGTLVAVPGRHRLLYRTVDGADAGIALRRMFDVARREFRDAPGPLSPDVFWVRNRRWVPVTSCDGGKPRVVPGELRDVLKGF